jgi:hypothetical protein
LTHPNDAPHLTWAEPACPAAVEFSAAALERLRLEAVRGLLALPRTGLGVGGFLIGSREDRKIRINDSTPIACSHAAGPAFRLTPAELADAVTVSAQYVGIYVTKMRLPFEPDLEIYAALCPEPWQVMVLIRPGTDEGSVTALVYRNQGGEVVQGAERELPAHAEVPADEVNFSPVRIFGLVPHNGKSTRRVIPTFAPAPDAADDPDTPYGFQAAPGVRLTGKPAPPRSSLPPQDSIPEESPAYEPIRTVQFFGKQKVSATARVYPDFELLLEHPVADPEPETGEIQSPAEPVEFQPARKNMFFGGEPAYPPRPVGDSAEQVKAAALNAFVEPQPKRSEAAPEPVTAFPEGDGPHGFNSVRSATFMSRAEKLAILESRKVIYEDEPAEPRVVTPTLSPEALARRKWIFRGAGAIGLGAVVYTTRSVWLPKPLRLELTDSNAHVTALWNAEILAPGTPGTLTLDDGGQKTVMRLDASKVAAGVIGFDRKSTQLTATLNVGDKTVTTTFRVGSQLQR